MGENSAIAWTHNTFNPWMGCMKVSPGCANCYAEAQIAKRWKKPLWGPAATTERQRTGVANWFEPRRWNKAVLAGGDRHLTFCASLADVFEDHPALEPWRADLFALIRETPALTWQLLTKRPENLKRMLPADWGNGYPNVWLGTSIESMTVSARVQPLTRIPAALRFISYEPALGSLKELELDGLGWMIYGGESGTNRRPDRMKWALEMRDRCDRAAIPFFMKQVSAPRAGYLPDDCDLPQQFPVMERAV